MDLLQIQKRIPFWYQNAVSEREDRIRCVYLKSPPGYGKTSVLSKAPEMLSAKLSVGKDQPVKIGLVVVSGPLLTPADAVGYLVPKHTEDGRAESVFTDPFWFRTREGKRLDEYDGGIILVDEADKMDVDVKKVIGEAALSGRLGPHTLPKGWVVWMAGNRSIDNSGSTKELDHLINRRREIDVTPSIDAWENWAMKAGVMPLTIAFAKQNVEIVFQSRVPEKQGPWCTPRSLAMADSYLALLASENRGEVPDDPITVEETQGIIGGAAMQLFAFVKLEREMPSFESIVAAPDKVKVPTKADAMMLIAYNLAHRVSEDTADPVIRYVERMPKEFSTTFAKSAISKDFNLVLNKSFDKWCQDNSALMAAVQQASGR